MRYVRPLPGPSGVVPPGAAFGLALGQGLVGGVGNFVQGYQASKAAQIQQAMAQARMAQEQARFDREDETKRYVANSTASASMYGDDLRYGVESKRLEAEARKLAEAEAAQHEETWQKSLAGYREFPEYGYEAKVTPFRSEWFNPKTRDAAEEKMKPYREGYAKYAQEAKAKKARELLQRASARATAGALDREYFERKNKMQAVLQGFQNDKNLISLTGPAWERDAFKQHAGVIEDVASRGLRDRRPMSDAEQIELADALFRTMKRAAGPAFTPENEATFRQDAIDRTEYMLQQLPLYGY